MKYEMKKYVYVCEWGGLMEWVKCWTEAMYKYKSLLKKYKKLSLSYLVDVDGI